MSTWMQLCGNWGAGLPRQRSGGEAQGRLECSGTRAWLLGAGPADAARATTSAGTDAAAARWCARRGRHREESGCEDGASKGRGRGPGECQGARVGPRFQLSPGGSCRAAVRSGAASAAEGAKRPGATRPPGARAREMRCKRGTREGTRQLVGGRAAGFIGGGTSGSARRRGAVQAVRSLSKLGAWRASRRGGRPWFVAPAPGPGLRRSGAGIWRALAAARGSKRRHVVGGLGEPGAQHVRGLAPRRQRRAARAECAVHLGSPWRAARVRVRRGGPASAGRGLRGGWVAVAASPLAGAAPRGPQTPARG